MTEGGARGRPPDQGGLRPSVATAGSAFPRPAAPVRLAGQATPHRPCAARPEPLQRTPWRPQHVRPALRPRALLEQRDYDPQPKAVLDLTLDDARAGTVRKRLRIIDLPKNVTVVAEDGLREIEVKLIPLGADQ